MLGFLGVSTRPPSRHVGARSGFNPVLGFLGVSTPDGDPWVAPPTGVSIPCWVFWASRPALVHESRLESTVFQSRAGFSGRLDRSNPPMLAGRPSGFNPVLGFLGVSTSHQDESTYAGIQFQSRAGFSGRLDVDQRASNQFDPSSFNPVLGFLGVSTAVTICVSSWTTSFNPVLGFLGVSTFLGNLMDNALFAFQSRAGFSGRLDFSK